MTTNTPTPGTTLASTLNAQARKLLAVTTIAFGLQAGLAHAQPRDDRNEGPRQDQPQERRTGEPRHDPQRQEEPHRAAGQPGRQAPPTRAPDRRAADHHASGPGAHASARGPAADRRSDRGPGTGPDRRFHKGDRLPADYRRQEYVVDDWRDHKLSRPPRGQRWVQVGADFVLVAVTTGVIVQVVLSR